MHFIHKSADVSSAAMQTVRSAFEFSGQKCSACSRCVLSCPISFLRMVSAGSNLWGSSGSRTEPKFFYRAYVPDAIWDAFSSVLLGEIKKIKHGPVDDFGNFMGPVINKASFDKIKKYLDKVSNDASCKIIAGGICMFWC